MRWRQPRAKSADPLRRMQEPSISGLSSDEAERLLREWGPNEPLSTRRQATIVRVLRRFASPLVLILILASLVSLMAGDVANALIIVAIVVVSAAIEYLQTERSARSAEALKAKVAPTATALRDHKWVEVPRQTVVPGDALRLSAGDMVPADARLI